MKNITIITGGSSGLGFEIAKILSKTENVCLVARNEKKLKTSAKNIGKNAVYYAGDISDGNFVKNMLADLTKKFYINKLINAAGVGIFGSPESMDINKINSVINSNTVGLMNITYESLKNMNGGGIIVNIASTAGLKGNANESLYCASKWAVRGFTEALKAYYKGKNIKIIGVYPGGINTPFWNEGCGMQVDTTKFMKPEEVAEVIVSNISEKNSLYIGDITIERK